MKIFEAIVDDGNDVFKSKGYAETEKDFKRIYGGNGEFVRVTDITAKYPLDTMKVYEALEGHGFGIVEAQYIKAILDNALAAPVPAPRAPRVRKPKI